MYIPANSVSGGSNPSQIHRMDRSPCIHSNTPSNSLHGPGIPSEKMAVPTYIVHCARGRRQGTVRVSGGRENNPAGMRIRSASTYREHVGPERHGGEVVHQEQREDQQRRAVHPADTRAVRCERARSQLRRKRARPLEARVDFLARCFGGGAYCIGGMRYFFGGLIFPPPLRPFLCLRLRVVLLASSLSSS
jgi:hypothetical protein